MPGESGELRGLARSIDALFEPVGTAASSQEDEDPEAPTGALKWDSAGLPPISALPDEAVPIAESLSFASDEESVGSGSWGLETPLEGEPLPDALGGVEAEGAVESVDPTPSADESGAEVVPLDDLTDLGWTSADQEVVEDSRAEADPDEFDRAVSAFLSGNRALAAEVRSLAAALRERLLLDPVADAVERLVGRADDPPDGAAVELAKEIINPAVASRIVQRIGREHDEVRRAEYEVLCREIGRPMAEAFRGALTDSTDLHARRAYYDMLIAMGDASRPVIEGMVEDDNRFLVRNAVAILGEIGGDRATELVTSALANTDPRVRREALLSLAKLGGEDAGPLVVALLEDADQSVRIAAVTAAGELAVARAVRPLSTMLEAEQDEAVVVPVLLALGQIGDPGAVPLIEKRAVRTLLSKPPTPVRIAAYTALARIGTPHARDLLRAASEDKDVQVAAVARDLSRRS